MKIRDRLNLLCGYNGNDIVEGFGEVYSSLGIPEIVARKWIAEDPNGCILNKLPMDTEIRIEDLEAHNKTLETQDDEGEFLLHGVITSSGTASFLREMGEDAVSAKDLREFLAENESDVTLRINTPGGSTSQAAEMISMLAERRKKGSKITAIVDGFAASAGGIILLSANERLVSEYAQIMFHRAHISLFIHGNMHDIREITNSVINQMESFDAVQIAAFERITGKSKSEVIEIFDKETWFNSNEAIENKIATGKAFDEPEPESPSVPDMKETKAIEDAGRDLINLYELAALMS